MHDFAQAHGFLVFLLALCVGVIGGALAHRWSIRKAFGELARGAAMVAGFIVGFLLVYIVFANL